METDEDCHFADQYTSFADHSVIDPVLPAPRAKKP